MSNQERRRVHRASERIAKLEGSLNDAWSEWAVIVRRIGISAVARELGVSRQYVSKRVLAAERRAKS
jgi:hypothetical protein